MIELSILLGKNYIKDDLDFGLIKVSYIKSVDQLVDMITRFITSGPFYLALSMLGMCDIYAPI